MNRANRVLAFVLVALLVGAVGVNKAEAQAYVRGDLGWSSANDTNVTDNNFAADDNICGDAGCNVPGTLDEIGSSFLLGAGVGYRFSSKFRADFTWTYRGGYELDDQDLEDPPNSFKGDITSHAFVANAYYDIPVKLGPVKPFVGVGVGLARNTASDIAITTPDSPGAVVTISDKLTIDFVWQLVAGFSWDISSAVSLEFGYRYVDAGEYETGNATTCSPAAACAAAGISLTDTNLGATGDLAAHEILVAVRYNF